MKHDGSTEELTVAARKAVFGTLAQGTLAIKLGFGADATSGQCATVTPTFRAKKKGTMVEP